MKPFLCALALLCTITAAAQTRSTDSTEYYRKEFARLLAEASRNYLASEAYKDLRARYEVFQQRTKGYIGTSVFIDRAQADFSTLNASIASDGFAPLSSSLYRIGFGMSAKSGKGMVDFNFLAFGLPAKTTRDGKTIRASFSNLLQMDVGYAIIDSRAFNLYPYAGLSFRMSSLSFEDKGQPNAAPRNITDLFSNRSQYYLNNFRIGYQAGLGIDLALAQTKEGTRAVLLFAKAGINRPIWKERYKKESVRIDPKIDFAEWMVTAGLKFVRRQ